MSELNNIIVEQARKYFKESRMYDINSQGNVEIEVYTDYNDVVDEGTIAKAFELFGNNIEEARNYLCEHIFECYSDYICDLEHETCKAVVEYIENNLDEVTLKKLEDECLLDTSEIRDVLMSFGVLSVYVDCDDILERSNIDLIISLENSVSVDYEFSLSNFNGNVLDWIEVTQEAIDNGEISEKDISLITLLKAQGYTFDSFKHEATEYFTKGRYKPKSKFIESLLDECYNTTSMCNALVFLKTVNLKDYLNGETIRTITKDTVGGYVDFVYGGGSTVNIALEKDFAIHSIQHEKFIDGKKYGYSFKEIYGDFIQ